MDFGGEADPDKNVDSQQNEMGSSPDPNHILPLSLMVVYRVVIT